LRVYSHEKPRGILPAVRSSFWFTNPPKPSGFLGIDSQPLGRFLFCYQNILEDQLPNMLTVLGNDSQNVVDWVENLGDLGFGSWLSNFWESISRASVWINILHNLIDGLESLLRISRLICKTSKK
jgi:hypothetical protein